MAYLYGFSAAHIQRYIVRSSRLRDIQGASELLERLCGNVFGKVVERAGLKESDILSQAAGGARLLSTDREAIDTLYQIWPLVAHIFAPGLEIDQAVVVVGDEGLAEAHRALSRRLMVARNRRPASLPVLGPLVRRAPRTGGGAIQFAKKEDGPIDAETSAKRDMWSLLRQGSRIGEGSPLDSRFLPAAKSGSSGRPSSLRFAGGQESDELANEKGYVALIHADGNNIGRIIDSVVSKQTDRWQAFKRFSNALKEATQEAAKQAVGALFDSAKDDMLPARPILLGGDDVTIVTNADLGFRFAETFLKAFEEQTRARKGDLPGSMTACAGIAFVKANYPYDRAHDLAEALCKRAKKHVRKEVDSQGIMPSAIAFHKVTTSLTDPEDLEATELTGPSGAILTMGAYRVGIHAGATPHLEDLIKLADSLPTDNTGGLRSLVDAVMESKQVARTRLERIEQVQKSRKQDPKPFKDALATLTGRSNSLTDELDRSPLLDALILKEFGGGSGTAKTHREAQNG